MKNNITKSKKRIFVLKSDGSPVGEIKRGNLVLRSSSDWQELKRQRGWALEENILVQAANLGVKTIVLLDDSSATVYKTSLSSFQLYGVRKNRSVFLPTKYWDPTSYAAMYPRDFLRQ